MSEIPKLKKYSDVKRPITVKLEPMIDEIYRLGRQNGWDVSEIARRALTDVFKKLASELKRPAS